MKVEHIIFIHILQKHDVLTKLYLLMQHYLLFKSMCGQVTLNEESNIDGLVYIRQRQLNFLLYGHDQPKFLVNQNSINIDFSYKYFFFLLFIIPI